MALAWLLAALALGLESPWAAGLLRGAPAWAPGGRSALVLLIFGCAAGLPRADGQPLRAATFALALAAGPLAAALALDQRQGAGGEPWSLVGVGLAVLVLGAAAGAGRGAARRSLLLALFLGVGIGLPLLASWAGAPELKRFARLSPLGWLARSARGPQPLDGWLAPFGAALLGLAFAPSKPAGAGGVSPC